MIRMAEHAVDAVIEIESFAGRLLINLRNSKSSGRNVYIRLPRTNPSP